MVQAGIGTLLRKDQLVTSTASGAKRIIGMQDCIEPFMPVSPRSLIRQFPAPKFLPLARRFPTTRDRSIRTGNKAHYGEENGRKN
jgi:hypothetical protein